MCPPGCARFVARQLRADDVRGRRILEVGSHDTAGVVRNILTRHEPVDYVGVDVAPGPGVDVVCPAEGLLAEFGPESFDVLVTTEVLEHVRDWRAVVHNLKGVLRDGGVLVATTRSPGFEFHGYPLDFWRYDTDDIRTIFGDLDIETLEEDPDDPGVFFRARRPALLHECDLTDWCLYSIVRRRRTRSFTSLDVGVARCLAAGQRLTARVLPLRARHAIRRTIEHLSPSGR
jgi:SAM-dependent methyltransferase